ncbi:MAG TPA: lysophospholipid acyltransferase family protein [Kofleriaceae bacterium]|nr:lysophospholipid acyltransferase family protein [Kofleriaceae bacterium]
MYPLKSRLGPLYWPYRAIRTCGVAFCFAAFWGGAVLVGWLWMPWLLLWPGTAEDKRRRVHRTMRRGFHLFHFTMRAMRLYRPRSLSPTARPNGAPVTAPCVLVANHPTLCDVTSIASLFPNVVAVARPSLANNPLLRLFVRRTGFVPVGMHMLQDCEQRLRSGLDVLIFPEGTRSPFGGGLQPFHRGAFEIAARANVKIVLLKLTCSPPALSKRLPIWKVADHCAVLTVEPVDMIDPAATGLGSKALCRVIEQRYAEMLGYSRPAVAMRDSK